MDWNFQPQSQEQKNWLGQHSAAYHQQLMDQSNHEALDYLVQARGLTLPQVERFQLGLVVSPLEGDEQFRGMYSIPYITKTGVVDLRYRRPPTQDTGAKYKGMTGAHTQMFNTLALDNPGSWICICEGEFDTIIADQCGIPVVGIPGATNWKPYYKLVFEGFSRVYVLSDQDDSGAGENFAEMVCAELEGIAINHKMPTGHDVNSFYLEAGAEALRKHVGL